MMVVVVMVVLLMVVVVAVVMVAVAMMVVVMVGMMYCVCHKICTSGSRCQGPQTFAETCTSRSSCACDEICVSRSTKYCACVSRFTSRSPTKVIRSKSAPKDNIKMPKRSFRSRIPPKTNDRSKSHESLHLPRTESTSKTTAMSKVPAPATKSVHQARKCARRHNESAVLKSTISGPADSASLRSRNALRRSRCE